MWQRVDVASLLSDENTDCAPGPFAVAYIAPAVQKPKWPNKQGPRRKVNCLLAASNFSLTSWILQFSDVLFGRNLLITLFFFFFYWCHYNLYFSPSIGKVFLSKFQWSRHKSSFRKQFLKVFTYFSKQQSWVAVASFSYNVSNKNTISCICFTFVSIISSSNFP